MHLAGRQLVVVDGQTLLLAAVGGAVEGLAGLDAGQALVVAGDDSGGLRLEVAVRWRLDAGI